MTDDHDWPYPGARWWKFDFHTHTPASRDTYWHRRQGSDDRLTAEQWLQRFMDAGVDCVAITDHNSGAWVDELKATHEAMRNRRVPTFRELHLFPGVEISVNSGFHLLAILDPKDTTSDVDTLLGAVDYRGDKGESSGVTHKSAIEVVEAVINAGGVPIPAHVEADKGLLRVKPGDCRKPEIDPNTIRQILANQNVHAMEVVDQTVPKAALYDDARVDWCEVLGSDCHSFRGAERPGEQYTWVKMESPSLEGLRLALMDGARFSIRRSDEPQPVTLPEHFVEAVEIDKARFMGRGQAARIAFSPRLNALIGGRGTGKSTVVHALRIAARRAGDLASLRAESEPRLEFDRFNRVPEHRRDTGGLLKNTNITWTVMRDGVRHRVRWPVEEGVITVEEEDGEDGWRMSPSDSVSPERFPIRIFSQGQIGALAGDDQRALLQVIDDAAGVAKLRSTLEELRDRFLASRARIRQLGRKLERRHDLVVELQDVERKLNRFEDAGHTTVLTTYRLRSRQRREADRQFDATVDAAESIESAAEGLHPDDLPDGLFEADSAEDQEAVAILRKLANARRAAIRDLHDSASRLRDAVQRLRSELADSSWQESVDGAMSGYSRLVATLREGGVSAPSEYAHLAQDRQRIDGELADLDSLQEEQNRLEEESQALLGEVLEARRAVSAARADFLASVLADNSFVRIRNCRYSDDRRAIEISLREELGVTDDRGIADDRFRDDFEGVVSTLLRDLPEESVERDTKIEARIGQLKARIRRACGGSGGFGGHFNNYLERESARTPELLDRALMWFPEDGLHVEYSRLGDGKQFEPITQASAGQRSAAMLAFLLAHGVEPLVLDQPEGDLDNHLIYDLIVRQVREQKLKRQIIVVTHNPNLVVNGDAEMVHVLDFHGQCYVKQKGSLQQDAMRDEICRVMEGGREAFERRYRRLGPEPTHVR
ncbi:MAG: hypothetical protein OXH99_17170 [Bryobacterales bacterium]|nr:chromosome segregation protein SMC [Gammaproteobacteria bacterium]MDE0628128.1 hypothetical protein [Bryobacterales bacterium]